ncbi:MAG: carboxypeptidase regulatory-like domain-containing protein [Phycisphaerales bacterium]|nr:MAG: carboxypeptidase regulatory-like domain-containing protein [Phycisphaerales bacterium]
MREAAWDAAGFALALAIAVAASWAPAVHGDIGPVSPPTVNPDNTQTDAPQEPDGPPGDGEAKPVVPSIVILDGQVTNPVGAGEEGVTVTVHRQSSDGAKGDLIATVTTSELGDFAVTAAEPIKGDIIVTLSKPNFADTVRKIHLGDDEYPPFLAEELEGKLHVSGEVRDELTDKPIPGAAVNLKSMFRDWYATTDDTGKFTIKGVVPGQGELIVEATGFGREQVPIENLGADDETVVRLKPERVLKIVVADEFAKPIRGATLEAYDKPRNDYRTAVTDEQGVILLRGIHFDAEILTARLTHEDHVSPDTFNYEIAVPHDKVESTHQLVMRRAGRISGKVTEIPSGKPVSGARVMTGEGHSDLTPRDWADYRGEYTITGVEPGEATVTVHRSGYAPELKVVSVKAAETTKLDIKLGEASALKGLVKTESGKPAAGAFVETTQWRGKTTLGLRALTGSDGRFVIESAPRDRFEIVVYARCSQQVHKVVTGAAGELIEIILPEPKISSEAKLLKLGDPVPDLTLKTLAGERIELVKLKGKVVLLDFWATWCGPCIEEIPKLTAVNDRFAAHDDFVLISVSLDGDEKMLRRFLEKRKLDWHHVFGEEGGARETANRFGVVGLPMVVLIGADGTLVARDLRGDGILTAVTKALEDQDSK